MLDQYRMSMISNRTENTCIKTTKGVPQGSKISPIAFNLYADNMIRMIISKLFRIGYKVVEKCDILKQDVGYDQMNHTKEQIKRKLKAIGKIKESKKFPAEDITRKEAELKK